MPTEPDQQNEFQSLLSTILLKSPGTRRQLLTDFLDLPDDIAGALPTMMQQRERSFNRKAAGAPSAGLLQFLLGS
jgi:hypothetical protein